MRAEGWPVGPDGPVRPRGGALADLWRRAVDVVAAAVALALVAGPIALLALLVRLESPGSPFYRQVRAGRHGREFELVKLRTMVDGAERLGAGLALERGDPRITPLGRRLRRWSLDELPQLVNVLKGDMGLVGPRPTLPHQVATYDERQRERLLVRPGLTGWAQVHGRTSLTWPERIELDRWYVANRSLRVDLWVLWRSIGVVLGGEGVEREGRAWVDPA